MKKFKFSLQKVLEYNTHIQKREKELLAVMRAEYAELEKHRNRLNYEYELNKQYYFDQCAQGTSMTGVATILRYISEIEKKIFELEKIMEEKKLRIDDQIEKLTKASKETKTVEKLKDSKLRLYHAAERKSEETSVEEFVSHTGSVAG